MLYYSGITLSAQNFLSIVELTPEKEGKNANAVKKKISRKAEPLSKWYLKIANKWFN